MTLRRFFRGPLDAPVMERSGSGMIEFPRTTLEDVADQLMRADVHRILTRDFNHRPLEGLVRRHAVIERRLVTAICARFWRLVAGYLYLRFMLADLERYRRPRGGKDAMRMLEALEGHLLAAADIAARFRVAAVEAKLAGGETGRGSLGVIAERLEEAIATAGLPKPLRDRILKEGRPGFVYRPGDLHAYGDPRSDRLVGAAAMAAALARGIPDEDLLPLGGKAGNKVDEPTVALIQLAAILWEAVTEKRPKLYGPTATMPKPSPFLQFLELLWSEMKKTVYKDQVPAVPGVTKVRSALATLP